MSFAEWDRSPAGRAAAIERDYQRFLRSPRPSGMTVDEFRRKYGKPYDYGQPQRRD